MRNSRCKIVTLLAGMIGLTVLPAVSNTNVLFDDFNDGNFAGWTVDSGSWSVNNGTLVGHRSPPGIDSFIYTGPTNWSDFVLDVDVHFQDGSAMIMFRSTGHWINEYRFSLWSEDSLSYPNRFNLIEYNGGVALNHTMSLPHVDGNAACPVPIHETAHVRIEAIGSLLSFYIDDQLMYQLDDPTPLDSGQIGLGVVWNLTDGFDNVSVTLVPEPHAVPFFIGASQLVTGLHLRRKRMSRDSKGPRSGLIA